MSNLQVINDSNFAAEVENSSQPVMVDFYADWCAPCIILGPVVEQLARDYSGRAKVVKFDVDQNEQVPMKLGIRGIPTAAFYKDGKLVDLVVGLVPKEELSRRLDSLLSQQDH
ncbi:MAG: thioredoxin [Candidatus Glassbacteria bacterium]|nr:thioredoxin [Candidatus Glassbacteria bacterium]